MLSEDALERERFRGDDVNLEIPSTQRGRGLEPHEAAADHHGALGALRVVDDRAAVGERAERVYVRLAPGTSRRTASAPVASSSASYSSGSRPSTLSFLFFVSI